jgi:tetratricopeptide (TPR) repeat protein
LKSSCSPALSALAALALAARAAAAELPPFAEALAEMGLSHPEAASFETTKSHRRGRWARGKAESYWTLAASGGGRRLRLEASRNVSADSARRRIDDKFQVVEGLFSGRAYYPGMVTHIVDVPEPLRPRLVEPAPAGEKTLLLYATDALTYGAGADELAALRGFLTFRYCPETRTLVQIELFQDKRSFAEAALRDALAEFRCGPRDARGASERETLERLAREDPSAERFRELGLFHWREGRIKEAEKSFSKAERLSPRDARYPAWRARLYSSTGRYARALEAADRALALKPDDYDALLLSADIRLSLGQAEEARKLHRAAADVCPSCGEAYIKMGYAEIDEGDFEEALASFETARQADPDDPEPHHHIGHLHVLAGRYAEAEGHLRASLEKTPPDDVVQSVHARRRLVTACRLQGRKTEAEEHYRRMVEDAEKARDRPKVLHWLGEAAAELGRRDESEAHYRALLELAERQGRAPRAAETCFRLAEQFAADGRFAEAEAMFERSLSHAEKLGDAGAEALERPLAGLARLYGRWERPGKLDPVYARAAALLDASPGRPVLVQLAREAAVHYRRKGDEARARRFEARAGATR